MIRDFKKTRENLKEIADVINSFKSEAVQLRLLELVLSMDTSEEVVAVAEVPVPVPVLAPVPVPVPAPVVEELLPVIESARAPRKKRETKEKVVSTEKRIETRGRKPKIAVVVPPAAPAVVEVPEPEIVKDTKPEIVKEIKKAKKAIAKKASKPAEAKKSTQERPGPSVILRTLVADNYFTENRTIGQVVKHCLATYQFQYASTDLSGTLARLVKENILKREKNAESNQFEYVMV
jgi:hypothetical protein